MIAFGIKQHISLYISYASTLFFPQIANYLNIKISWLFLLGGLLGCSLPDTDHRNSIAGHIIPIWLVFKHGKQTHTLLASFIFFIPYWYTQNELWIGIWFGYMTHLIGDNLQGNNLKYLYYPFKRRKKVKR